MGKSYYNISNLSKTRKKLRNEATKHERIIWEVLKGRKFNGLKFRRQYSIGRYIIDFYCVSKRIGIEIDGDNHLEKDVIEYDNIRTEYIESAGVTIYRFTNNEIENNLELTLEKLNKYILDNHSQ